MNQVLEQKHGTKIDSEGQRIQYEQNIVQLYLDVLNELKQEIDSNAKILDFGCGDGKAVYHYRKMGLEAFGVDIVNKYDSAQKLSKEVGLFKEDEDIFRTIGMDDYRLPFDDSTFDLVVSDQVFEHVQNWPEALAEIKRVLKLGGSALHVFPSRFRPIEGHVLVPLAGIFQGYPYLAFWAFLGIRNSFQQQLSWKKVAALNYEFLRNCTTYYHKVKIKELVTAEFGNVSFVEGVFIEHHFDRIGRYLAPLSRKLPFVSSLFCTFHSRVVFFKKL